MRPGSCATRTGSLFVLLLVCTSAGTGLQGAETQEALIVKCTRPCLAVTAAVASAGGEVTQVYDNLDAVAVRVPGSRLVDLVEIAGSAAIRKDVVIDGPPPMEVLDLSSQATARLSGSDVAALTAAAPDNYNFNNALNRATPLHNAGKIGAGVVVAVIDSGTAALAPALAGRVVGGENFVPGDPLSATHHENGWHGTGTAEMVAANTGFVFSDASAFVRSLRIHAPDSVFPAPPPIPGGFSVVPMTGTAPGARLYAMKVFPSTGGGAPESRIIAAMDRAITLRRNFNRGVAVAPRAGTGSDPETNPAIFDALNIEVVNMSLGGPTLFAGRDLEDQLTLAMLDAGITIVTSVGNDGFAAMTGGSPGTGFGSLTVGAASTAVHERVLRDNANGVGAGALFRPTTHTQTAFFSSRGPTADGRIDPDIVANGFASYIHVWAALTAGNQIADCREPAALPGTCIARILFASGTSFSAPSVAGAAALLRREHPQATATQIRNALQQSARLDELGDDSTPIDQGNGFLDLTAADTLLATRRVSGSVPGLKRGRRHGDDRDDELGRGGRSVAQNVQRAGFDLVRFRGNRATSHVRNLKPGEVAQLFVPADAFTTNLRVTIGNITPELPPADQNFFFGDDIVFHIVDAPTSFNAERAFGFTGEVGNAPVTIDVTNPQTGLVRVALQGDWTNAGRISATVTIERERRLEGLPSAVDRIEQDETLFYEFNVPVGTAQAVFEASWLRNWSRYPTNDLDMILIDPLGNENVAGATVNSPERVTIANPTPGRWTVALVGFTVHADGEADDDDHRHRKARDVFTLSAFADGKRLKALR